MAGDWTEELLGRWGDLRPELDLRPYLVTARISRLALHVARSQEEVFARFGLNRGEVGVLSALRTADDMDADDEGNPVSSARPGFCGGWGGRIGGVEQHAGAVGAVDGFTDRIGGIAGLNEVAGLDSSKPGTNPNEPFIPRAGPSVAKSLPFTAVSNSMRSRSPWGGSRRSMSCNERAVLPGSPPMRWASRMRSTIFNRS